MEDFVQLLVTGLAAGAIYASIALALVVIHEATDLINFSQGEMAMFSTYIAWTLVNAGVPYWTALVFTIAGSFLAGVFIEVLVIRRFASSPTLTMIIVFIGLLVIFNSLAGWIWSYTLKPFPSPFPEHPFTVAGVSLRMHDVGVVAVTLCVMTVIYGFFRFTSLGLAMRAAAQNPASSRLVGIHVDRMRALGWGMAAALGALAGVMVAPILFLDPSMMSGVLLYGFAGALLGGIGSPGGAVAGGFIVGVLENMLGTYAPLVGNELKLTVALLVIVAVLVLRPSGLFGRSTVRRV